MFLGGAGAHRGPLNHRWRGGWTLRGLSPEATEWATPDYAAGLRDSGLNYRFVLFSGLVVWAPDPEYNAQDSDI